jgi:predicted N-acetyltransferase YhbS
MDGRTRPDGIELRSARADDVDQILALVGDRLGEDGVAPAAVTLAGADGPPRYMVAADGDRVVAVTALWQDRVRVGPTVLPAGQIDFVASLSGYGGRGLVRDLMTMALARSGARGDVVQIMIGIPYFYRQFGFCYVIPLPDAYHLRAGADLAVPAGVEVRPAGPHDLPGIRHLQDAVQAGYDVAMSHNDETWRWLSGDEPAAFHVAVDGSGIRGFARHTIDAGDAGGSGPCDITVAEVAAAGVGPVRALLADARSRARGGTVRVKDRPGAAVSAVLPAVGWRDEEDDRYMVRVARPVALLDMLRPTLSARLAASHFAAESGELLVSFYRHSAVLTYADGTVTAVTAAPGQQGPVAAGGVGVPPDVVADLVFGPHGAARLERRHADCNLGPHRAFADVLFPAVSADVLTFYVP